MKGDALIEFLESVFNSAASPLQEYAAEREEAYDVKARWGASDASAYLPHREESGVYIYASRGGEVLYVGKADQQGVGGLGNRASAHLEPYRPEGEVMFPEHDWADDPSVDGALKHIIATGDFLIHTIKITPGGMSRFAEHLLLVACKHFDGGLPPLNKRE